MRQRFTERIGKRSPKSEVQIESMDMDLRNGLWNVVTSFICQPMMESTMAMYNSRFEMFINDL